MTVKNNLKDLRYEHKMNQIEFAAHLNVNRQLYNRWENQATQPSLEWILKIAQKLNKQVEDIVYLDEAE
ncbi:helix-turn-helix transcriptional regulator [Aneurinibacillus tyrosinisolvens]|uniref:helix-turn-helix transcriptional regulator n=1 Tax=Aneurinibacillus tyrosinisolvens TaxID=1443435 RepID=UPI00063F8E49|nr:helix-turn-helix domain-containing protein [Aneurinibacillus tyrosinisolvens]